MELLGTLAVSLAVSAAAHPLYSFTLLAWNQPASFVAAFARRRISFVSDLFEKRSREHDPGSTTDFYWYHLASRAWLLGAATRGVALWAATGGLVRSARFLKKQAVLPLLEKLFPGKFAAASSATEIENKNDTATAVTAATTAAAHAATAAAVSLAMSPLTFVLTIFVNDISGGYRDAPHAWKALVGSAEAEWWRQHPPYKSGGNPWTAQNGVGKNSKVHRWRPSPAGLVLQKMTRDHFFTNVLLAWAGYAAAMAAVSGAMQVLLSSRGEKKQQLEQTKRAEADGAATRQQQLRRIGVFALRRLETFVASAALHGAVAYLFSGKLATATAIATRSTDYQQPYDHEHLIGDPTQRGETMPYSASDTQGMLADANVLKVPKIDLMFACVEGLVWGAVETVVVMVVA